MFTGDGRQRKQPEGRAKQEICLECQSWVWDSVL